MKANVVCAHPAADSYNASLHQRLLRTLDAASSNNRGPPRRPVR
jgi:hypothetical protein